MKRLLLFLLLSTSLYAIRLPKWFKKSDNPTLDFACDILNTVHRQRKAYPDRSIPQYNFRIAQILKMRGDTHYKNETKKLYFDSAEKYAFVAASQILNKAHCSKKDIARAEHYLHFAQRIDKWRLFTFGIRNYYLREEPLLLWPKVRIHKQRFSED